VTANTNTATCRPVRCRRGSGRSNSCWTCAWPTTSRQQPTAWRVAGWLHVIDFGVADRIEVTLNGVELACTNPLIPGQMETPVWLSYEPAPELVHQGANKVGVRLLSRDLPPAGAGEAPIDVADVELEIRYVFPDGKAASPAAIGRGRNARVRCPSKRCSIGPWLRLTTRCA